MEYHKCCQTFEKSKNFEKRSMNKCEVGFIIKRVHVTLNKEIELKTDGQADKKS